jgi:hypothetical protein
MIQSAKHPNGSRFPLMICLESEAGWLCVAQDRLFKDYMFEE